MGIKIYGVVDCETLNCFGAYLTLERAIRQGYKYSGWAPRHGFQVVVWDDDAPVDWGHKEVKFVSIEE